MTIEAVQEETVEQDAKQVFYKCPNSSCPCFFVSSHDLHVHMTSPSACKARVDKLGWRRSSFDDSEICPSERDPELARACRQNGKVVMGI